MPMDPSHLDPELPDLDDRLVEPETRYEMLDGRLVYVPPADEARGECHAQLATLVAVHVDPDLGTAMDMLLRTSKVDDIAPDVTVYPAADPVTGRQQLPALAFEVVDAESLDHAGIKAAKLVRRGVRRVFAIDVKRSQVLEWSAALGTWSPLDPAGYIEDPALAVPLPIAAMISNDKTEDAVARALLAKGNLVLAENRAKGRAEGFVEGKASAVIAMLVARGIALDDGVRKRILGERDEQHLERWVVRAFSCTTAGELLTEP